MDPTQLINQRKIIKDSLIHWINLGQGPKGEEDGKIFSKSTRPPSLFNKPGLEPAKINLLYCRYAKSDILCPR